MYVKQQNGLLTSKGGVHDITKNTNTVAVIGFSNSVHSASIQMAIRMGICQLILANTVVVKLL